jgi:hypothetical protein
MCLLDLGPAQADLQATHLMLNLTLYRFDNDTSLTIRVECHDIVDCEMCHDIVDKKSCHDIVEKSSLTI